MSRSQTTLPPFARRCIGRLLAPVRWVEVVQALRARGLTHLVECGPGKVLAGMVKRIDATAVTMTIFDPATLGEAKELLA